MYDARTNKATHLINLGGNNIVVPAGTRIVVYGEDGIFGTVSVPSTGQPQFGSMLRSDYDPV